MSGTVCMDYCFNLPYRGLEIKKIEVCVQTWFWGILSKLLGDSYIRNILSTKKALWSHLVFSSLSVNTFYTGNQIRVMLAGNAEL